MNPKDIIKILIQQALSIADGDMNRVRIRTVCEKFSEECIDYPFEYRPEIESILIKDKSGISYRYTVEDFEKKIDNHAAAVVVISDEIPNFNFKKYLDENKLTVYDIQVAIAGRVYTIQPESPTLFDPACKPGCRCTVYLKDVNNPENKKVKNFKELEEMVKSGEAIIKSKV